VNVLALIPAKGQSQRLPRKNLVPLGGRPLLAWSVEAAQTAGIFGENIYVASEDGAALRLAEELKVRPLRRPDTLAAPAATVEDVIKWARATLEWSGAIYVLLPTSPFRRPETIRATWQQFRQRGVRIMMSLWENEHPPFWSILWDGPNVAPAMPHFYQQPRSALPRTFRHEGSHLIVGNGGEGIGVFTPPEDEVLDINTRRDLEFAEYLLAMGKVPGVALTAQGYMRAGPLEC